MARFIFTLDNLEDLETIKKLAGLRSRAQVIRRALVLYRQILEATADGRRLYVGKSPTEVQPLIVIVR